MIQSKIITKMTESYKTLLENKQKELTRSRANREEIVIERFADDIDKITSLGLREVSTMLMDASAKLLSEVRAALQRINHGDFGVCIDCEEPINDKRLKAIPWANRCVKCQEAWEEEKKNLALFLQEEEVA